MKDLYKTSSLIEYWVILQLQEQTEREIIHLIHCNNHEQNIQIYFLRTFLRGSWRTVTDDWHKRIKLLLIFPLTLTYEEAQKLSF